MNKSLFIALLFSLFTVACSKKSEHSSTYRSNFIAQDSIRINEYASLDSYDYNSDQGVFLLGDLSDGMSVLKPPGASSDGNNVGLLVVDKKGKILGRFNNSGEGPINHGIGSHSNLLLDSGKIGVFSRKGFFIYDYNGGLEKRIEDINSRSLVAVPYLKMASYSEGMLALGYTSFTKEAFENQDNPYPYLTSFKIFNLNKSLQPETAEQSSEVSSYGYPNKAHDETIVAQSIPFITVNRRQGVVNVLFSNFKMLNQYDISDGQLINRIELNPGKFQSGNKPKESEQERGYYRKLSLSNSAFHKMVQLGEYTLIRYSSAIPLTQVEQLISSGGPDESPYWEHLRNTSYKFYYLLIKDGEVVKQDFEIKDLIPQEGEEFFSSTQELRGQIIGGDGLDSIFVLYNNDYSKERPYKLIVRYSLKVE